MAIATGPLPTDTVPMTEVAAAGRVHPVTTSRPSTARGAMSLRRLIWKVDEVDITGAERSRAIS